MFLLSHSSRCEYNTKYQLTATLKAHRWRRTGYVKISSNSHQNAAATEHTEFWVSLQVPFPLQLADTADVPAFHSVAHALLWPVSKQKRLQLFSFSMCSYIIIRPASVTPPSLLRKRSYFLWKCQFFSKCSNAVCRHGDLMEMPFSLLISFLSICFSTFILPLSLCHFSYTFSSFFFVHCFVSFQFSSFIFSLLYFIIKPVEMFAAWILFQHGNNRIEIDFLFEVQWLRVQRFSTQLFFIQIQNS